MKRKYGNKNPHTAILVSKDSNGVTFFEANAKVENGKHIYNGIWTKTYTYDQLVNGVGSNHTWANQAMSIYYAK